MIEINKENLMEKLTKKQYKRNLESAIVYYMIDTVWNKNVYGVIDLLINKSFTKENLGYCKFYSNIKENSKDFLHTDGVDGSIMYESKKGNFYRFSFNNVTYLLHDYKDGAISVKAII